MWIKHGKIKLKERDVIVWHRDILKNYLVLSVRLITTQSVCSMVALESILRFQIWYRDVKFSYF